MSNTRPRINSQARRHNRYPSRDARTGFLATGLAVLALYGVSEGISAINGRDRPTTATEQLRIPAADEPYQVLVFGKTYVDRRGDRYTLGGVEGAAGYIHAMDPSVSEEAAKKLIMAENVNDQTARGETDADPLSVLDGQGIRLTLDVKAGGTVIEP